MEHVFTVMVGQTIRIRARYSPPNVSPTFVYETDQDTSGLVQISPCEESRAVDVYGIQAGEAAIEVTCDGITEVLKFNVISYEPLVKSFHFEQEEPPVSSMPNA